MMIQERGIERRHKRVTAGRIEQKHDRIEKRQKTFKRVIDPTMARIGARIRELRQKRSMTIVELARLIGSSGSALGQIENGWRTPSDQHLAKIAKALGTDQLYLVAGITQDEYRRVSRSIVAWNALHGRD